MTGLRRGGVVEFGVQLDAGLGVVLVAGAVEDGRFALVVDEGDGAAPEQLDGPAEALPLVLAELAGLGPRDAPAADAPVLVTEALDGADPRAALLAAWDPELREGTPLAGDGWALWSATAAWEVDGETVADGFAVVDGLDHGIALVHDTDEGVVVMPCVTTDVWIALCGLLPRAAELAPPAA